MKISALSAVTGIIYLKISIKKNISIKNVIVNEQNNYHYNINLFLNHHFEQSEQQEDNFKQCSSTQL